MITRREIALRFVRCFCTGDVVGLASRLVDDLRFRGPLHRYDSKQAYLQVFREDPPESLLFVYGWLGLFSRGWTLSR